VGPAHPGGAGTGVLRVAPAAPAAGKGMPLPNTPRTAAQLTTAVGLKEGREDKPVAAIARMVHLIRRTVYKALARQEQAG